MNNPLPSWSVQRLYVAAMVFTFVGGAVAGWTFGRAPLKADIKTMEADQAKANFRMAERNSQVLQAAQARGDALTDALAASQAKNNQLTLERRNAITQATTGRPCLGEPALRLLNGAPGLRVSGLPQAAGIVAAAGGAVATDTDIARWAIDAGAAHEACRARLDALIDWHRKDEQRAN